MLACSTKVCFIKVGQKICVDMILLCSKILLNLLLNLIEMNVEMQPILYDFAVAISHEFNLLHIKIMSTVDI